MLYHYICGERDMSQTGLRDWRVDGMTKRNGAVAAKMGDGLIGNTVRMTPEGPMPWLPPQLYAASLSATSHWRKLGRRRPAKTRKPGDLPFADSNHGRGVPMRLSKNDRHKAGQDAMPMAAQSRDFTYKSTLQVEAAS